MHGAGKTFEPRARGIEWTKESRKGGKADMGEFEVRIGNGPERSFY